jgi:hypothetical protein
MLVVPELLLLGGQLTLVGLQGRGRRGRWKLVAATASHKVTEKKHEEEPSLRRPSSVMGHAFKSVTCSRPL